MNPLLAPVEATPAPAHPARNPRSIRAWIAALLLALSAFALDTRNATFPYFSHVDEPAKVHQVQTGELNFHHPLLLLKTTDAALKLTGGSRKSQAVVEMGRHVSAAGTAVSVAALALLAGRIGGPLSGLLAGAVTLGHPMLFELSHYMKEDGVLLAGITATLALLYEYNEAPSLKTALLAGVTAGLAAAGKYVGFSMLALGLFAILRTPAPRGEKRNAALGFTAIALGVFAWINQEIFLNFKTATWGLGTEFTKMQAASESSSGFFQSKYLTGITSYVSAPLLVGVIFWTARRWRERAAQRFGTWMLLGFPILLILMMSFSPKIKDRYVLPAAVILGLLGSIGIVEIARTARFRYARPLAGLLAAAALVWLIPDLQTTYPSFRRDDRLDLVAWMREHLPADAFIVCDGRTRLDYAQQAEDPAFWFPQNIWIAEKSVADLGTLEELRAKGIHYAVVAEQIYGEFINPLSKGKKPNHLRATRQAFYKELFSTGQLLWELPRGTITYLHPGLKLYKF